MVPSVCPTCGHPLTPADPVDQLRDACRERGLWLSHDERVREADAAALLGLAAKTLRNWRYEAQPLAFIMRGGRPLYALGDLAAWLGEG